jgi:uncharacterized protein (TIGR03000 family)
MAWGGSGMPTYAYGNGYAIPTYVYGNTILPSTVVVPSSGTPPYQSGYFSPGTTDAQAEGRATLIVHLPADARLTIDGAATRSTTDTRTFVSPPLEPGKTYQYRLEAQVERNGETAKASRNVEVHAGRQSEVYLEFPMPGANRRE